MLLHSLALPKHILAIDLDIAKQGCFFASSTSLTVGICWSFYWRQCWLRKWFSFTSSHSYWLTGSKARQFCDSGSREIGQLGKAIGCLGSMAVCSRCFALLGHTPEWQSKQNSWNVRDGASRICASLASWLVISRLNQLSLFINGEQSKNRENPPAYL